MKGRAHHARFVLPHPIRFAGTGQPHRHSPDVHVLGRGRLCHQLAPDALRPAGPVRRRPADPGSHRRRSAGPHQRPRPGPVERCPGAGAAPGAGAHPPPQPHARVHAAGPRRPQGQQPPPLGRRWRPARRPPRGLAHDQRQRPGLPAHRPAAVQRHAGRHRADHAGLRRCRPACAQPGAGCAGAARRPRLPAAPVPVAPVQPARRRLWRQPEQPHAPDAGGVRRHPGSPAGGLSAGRAHLRHRLGGRRLGPGAKHPTGPGPGSARLRLPACLQRRPAPGAADSHRPRLPGATGRRPAPPPAGGHARDCRGPDHRCATGPGHPGCRPGRCHRRGPRHALQPALALGGRPPAGRPGGGRPAVPALRATWRKGPAAKQRPRPNPGRGSLALHSPYTGRLCPPNPPPPPA